MDSQLTELLNALRQGHAILSARFTGQMHGLYDAWLQRVSHGLEHLSERFPQKHRLLIEWLGLPSPLFRVSGDRHIEVQTVEFDSVDVQRCMEARCTWLSKTLLLLDSPIGLQEQLTIEEQVKVEKVRRKPRMFIGSSREGLKYARKIEEVFYREEIEITLWSNGPFGLGEGTLETLVQLVDQFDFAALVLTPDDLTESRGEVKPAPRDNVLFEAGLFMGRIKRFRTFVVYNEDDGLKLPSDLAGITAATFKNRSSDSNIKAQVSPACTQMLEAIEKLGPLEAGAIS
jgi:predicted nucleotide-binding protein